MRVGIIGVGTIGRYVLETILAGQIPGAVAAGVCVRDESSPAAQWAAGRDVPVVTNVVDLIRLRPDVVMETASHQALEQYGPSILRAGIDLIPLSLGALVDARLLESLIEAAEAGGSYLQVPSGGIGGLDAMQAVIEGGVTSVTMTSRKPPRAWKGIEYVEGLGIDLDSVAEPTVLYEGSARDCVKKFPQNINIAAALSLAGVGFDRTMIRILADPTISSNRHEIHCEGDAGRFTVIMENKPVSTNPKTSHLACLSAVATLRRLRAMYRVGT